MNMNVDPKVLVGICPGCGAKIRFHRAVHLGEFVSCDECDDELEVIQVQPLKLDWAYADPLDDDDIDYDDDFFVDDDDDDDGNDYYDWEYD